MDSLRLIHPTKSTRRRARALFAGRISNTVERVLPAGTVTHAIMAGVARPTSLSALWSQRGERKGAADKDCRIKKQQIVRPLNRISVVRELDRSLLLR